MSEFASRRQREKRKLMNFRIAQFVLAWLILWAFWLGLQWILRALEGVN